MSRWARLVAKVDAMEDSFHRLRRAEEAAAALEVAHPVAGDLGTVWVGGSGQLLDIELDARKLRYTNAAALGPQLLGAIRAAEAEVLEARRGLAAAGATAGSTDQEGKGEPWPNSSRARATR
jgi:DNA-binding protein YbaB